MMPEAELKEYKVLLAIYFGIQVSQATICRCLNILKLTLKKATIVFREKYSFVNLMKARTFFELIARVDPRTLHFLDECGVSGKTD